MSIISNAKEIAELVRDAGNMELYRKMIDLERQIVELQGENLDLAKHNRELKEKLAAEQSMTYTAPVYYAEGDEQPFCAKCWEVERVQIHLAGPTKCDSGRYYQCRKCTQTFWTERWEPPPRPPPSHRFY